MSLVETVQEIAPKYGLQPDWVLAVIEIESGYRKSPRPRYESHIQDWSFGYGQVLSSTAAWLFRTQRVPPEVSLRWYITCPRVYDEGLKLFPRLIEDEQINIHLLCAYLEYQFQRYGDLDQSVAAYNAGSVRYNDNGSFVNQYHVDKFNKALERIRKYETYDMAVSSFGSDNDS